MVPYCRGGTSHTFSRLSLAATVAPGLGHTSGNSSTSEASNFSFFLLGASPSPSSCFLLPSETVLSPGPGASMELVPTSDGDALVLASRSRGVEQGLRTALICESGGSSGSVFGVDMLGDMI
jgi:hypothetical protein